jgi:hypothetical protein
MAKRRKETSEIQAMDPGAPLLVRHFKVVPKLTDNSTRAMRVLDGTEIDALLFRDEIDHIQHSTLTLFSRRLQSYGYMNLKSPSLEGGVSADPAIVSDKKAQALRGAVQLIDRLDRHPHIGKYRRKKLVQLATEDAAWGKLRHQIEELHSVIRALDDILMKR